MGHSLGAAIAQIVHIHLHDEFDCETVNVTFAAPLVGNVALREQLAVSGAGQPMRNMYHFVLDTDIVPSGKSLSRSPPFRTGYINLSVGHPPLLFPFPGFSYTVQH